MVIILIIFEDFLTNILAIINFLHIMVNIINFYFFIIITAILEALGTITYFYFWVNYNLFILSINHSFGYLKILLVYLLKKYELKIFL